MPIISIMNYHKFIFTYFPSLRVVVVVVSGAHSWHNYCNYTFPYFLIVRRLLGATERKIILTIVVIIYQPDVMLQ